jgi:hypothetical protein
MSRAEERSSGLEPTEARFKAAKRSSPSPRCSVQGGGGALRGARAPARVLGDLELCQVQSGIAPIGVRSKAAGGSSALEPKRAEAVARKANHMAAARRWADPREAEVWE